MNCFGQKFARSNIVTKEEMKKGNYDSFIQKVSQLKRSTVSVTKKEVVQQEIEQKPSSDLKH